MLNRYCSQNELEKTLSNEEFRNISYVLNSMLPTSENRPTPPIYQDSKILGQIHHTVNLGKYANKYFREQLYMDSKDRLNDTWGKYFETCGIKGSIKDSVIKKYIKFNWGNNTETKRFVDFFKYPTYMIPDEKEDYPPKQKIFGKNAEFEPLKFLLEYQSDIVSRIIDILRIPNAYCLMQMPTGTGKTRTAMEIVARLFNTNPNNQIVWFANKSELLGQAYESFVHVWNHLGKFPVTAIVAWGSKTIPKIPDKGTIIFAGYKKMQNFLESNNSLKPQYIVVDEAHQILAPTYKKQLSRLAKRDSARVLGLTATPGRGINAEQNKLLANIFHKKIVQIELYGKNKDAYENNIIRYLEDREILARAEFDPLRTDVRYDLFRDDWKKLTKLVQGDLPEFTTKILQEIANNNTRNILIINKLRDLAQSGKKILYFGTSVSQSLLVFIILQQLGINAIHIDGKTQHWFRRQVIRKFVETDEIKVICNYDIFSTGFDVPQLDVVFIGRPVMSPVLFNQMVGRGTRGISMNGKKSFLLVQVIDDIRSGSSKFDPYEQYGYWDENW